MKLIRTYDKSGDVFIPIDQITLVSVVKNKDNYDLFVDVNNDKTYLIMTGSKENINFYIEEIFRGDV